MALKGSFTDVGRARAGDAHNSAKRAVGRSCNDNMLVPIKESMLSHKLLRINVLALIAKTWKAEQMATSAHSKFPK